MILYHGSNAEVSRVDLSRCTKYKDFGQGFYLTSIKQQAREWAEKVARRFNAGKPTLNIYDFDDDRSGLKSLDFTEPDEKWAAFIINNRNRNFTNHGDILSNHDNKYDFVHGLVANDDISTVLEAFLLGILPISEISKALTYKQLNDQYSFHTEKAVARLKFLRSETL
jgi:hypothetical protein